MCARIYNNLSLLIYEEQEEKKYIYMHRIVGYCLRFALSVYCVYIIFEIYIQRVTASDPFNLFLGIFKNIEANNSVIL